MPFVSVTRLRLRSLRFFPAFFWITRSSARQARRAPGCLGIRLRKTRGLTFWTLSAWESEQEMAVFRGQSPHREAMARLPQWCDEASVAHWIEEAAEWSSWDRAARRLQEQGRLSLVLHPSAAHADGRIDIS